MAAVVEALVRAALPASQFALFSRADFELLASHGIVNAVMLSKATEATLLQALPNRVGLVAPLLQAFSASSVLVQMFQDFHRSKLVRLTSEGKVVAVDPKDGLTGCILKLSMPSGYHPNDVPPNRRLYVRQDCEELYKVLLSELEQKATNPNLVDPLAEGEDEGTDYYRGRRFWKIYLGNPGTGKSLTGLELVFLFVSGGYTVVYYMEKLCPGTYVVFREGKLDSVVNFAKVTQYLVNPEAIYIHDGSKIEGTGFIKAATLLITSPDQKVYKDFTKVSGGYGTFYGRLWSMEELEACCRTVYWSLEWASVRKNVYFVGRIPRLVFVTPIKFKSILELLPDLFSLIGPHNIDETFSHKLVHLDRGQNVTQT